MDSDVAVQVALVTAGATLAGVALTSFLSAVSTWVKERRAEKRELGLLVSELFRLHHEMGEMKDLIMRNTARGGQPKSDILGKFAMMATTKYLLDHEKVSAAIDLTKKHIAARNPVLATRLESVRDILWQARDGTKTLFDDQSKTEYMATVVFGFEAYEPELARVVLMLARMHGWVTWWRVKRAWKTRVRDDGGWVKVPPPEQGSRARDAQ